MAGKLAESRNLDFVDRALRPEKYPVINNPDGSVSTHLMSSTDDIAYPNIVRKPGEGTLTKLPPVEAHDYARKSGEFVKFNSPEEANKFASGGYKDEAAKLRKQTSAAAPGENSLAPIPLKVLNVGAPIKKERFP